MIVNKSRVRWRGMAFTLPIRLQDLDKVPSITANVRNMLMEHPKVYLETEMPRCHVTKVGGLSIELTISCNLKPMVSLWALMCMYPGFAQCWFNIWYEVCNLKKSWPTRGGIQQKSRFMWT